jgi:hypothetical protein
MDGGEKKYGILLTPIARGQDAERVGFDYIYADRFTKDGTSMGVTLRPPHPSFVAKVAADADAIALALDEPAAFTHKTMSQVTADGDAPVTGSAASADQGLSKAAVAGLAVAGTVLVVGVAFLALRGSAR